MLNWIWLGLMLVSVIYGACAGTLPAVTKAAFDSAGTAVTVVLGLVGVLALWLGLMKVAEEAGLIRVLAKILRPVSRVLFPGVPEGHPAITAMLLNLSANWLGLSNAATPLGLKAMEELQTLNDDKTTITDDMATFLAMNTASITLIPATMIGVRLALNSANPQEIVGTTIFASVCATLMAIVASKILQRLPIFSRDHSRAKSKSNAEES